MRRSFSGLIKGEEHNIIVVDDEALIRRVVQVQLKRVGVCQVVDLADGDELLEALGSAEAPPTCILLDIVMKRSNGVAVLQALRRHEMWGSLPVYAMTSNVEAVESYREEGFTGLLGKPFVISHLTSVLLHSKQSPEERSFLVASAAAVRKSPKELSCSDADSHTSHTEPTEVAGGSEMKAGSE